MVEILTIERPTVEPPRDTYIYNPDTACVPGGVAVNIRGRNYDILANVEIEDADAGGMIFVRGSRFGGHALVVKDKRLCYTYNFLSIQPEQTFEADVELEPGTHTLRMGATAKRMLKRH